MNTERGMSKLIKEFLMVTQSAAVAVHSLVGKGDEYSADKLATGAMRNQLNQMSINGVITIGEGEMDKAPMLYIGERVGTGQGAKVDIAVDPIDGTSLVGANKPNAISVMAVAERDGLLHAPDMYMEKIVVGKDAAHAIDIEKSLTTNIKNVAKAKNKPVTDMVVTIQNRERHRSLIKKATEMGAKVKLFQDVDVVAALMPCIESSDVDLFVGIGGAPEGVIGAVGVKSLKGNFQGRLLPANKQERKRCQKMGIANPEKILNLKDIVPSDKTALYASGITEGMLLDGLIQTDNGICVHSIYIDSITHSYSFFREIIKTNEGDVYYG